jgi:hypothetical protein
MTRVHIHKPPSAAIVAELVRAGVSLETAQAMERWKADEVLELLRFRPDPGHQAGLRAIKGVASAC